MKTRFTLHYVLVAACFLLFATTAFSQPTFINKIPIPPLVDMADGTIVLKAKQIKHKFNPNSPTVDTMLNGFPFQDGITTWAYNLGDDSTMTYLGPTLKWHTGDSVNIQVINELTKSPPNFYGNSVNKDTSIINTTITTHWHGAELPAQFDGGPHQPIPVSDTFFVDFLNVDEASTLWYHPHFHNNTIEQVSMGLSGMIISEQPDDLLRPVLPHTYGVDDFPVIIGDAGTLNQNDTIIATTGKGNRPYNIVNGVTNPFLEVPNALVRLRILNGSSRKGLQIAVSDSYTDTLLADMEEFIQVATDGGYTLKPNSLKTLLNGPGARDEIVIDLSGRNPGDELYLRNLKELMPGFIVGSPHTSAGPAGGNGGDPTSGNAFLLLKVVDKDTIDNYTPITTFTPYITDWVPSLQDTMNIDARRLKMLVKSSAPNPVKGFSINNKTYDMMYINDTICVGAKEIWTIHNTSPVAHPFHIHKIFFRILDIEDTSTGEIINLEERGLNGPKDDVLVLPNWKLRFLAKFDDYPNAIVPNLSYMYHCHILTHEDALGGGMMAQFVVTDEGPCKPANVNEELLPDEKFVLFPNPTYGALYMNARSEKASIVRIVDLQGHLLREQSLPAIYDQVTIDIHGLQPGLYIVNWKTVKGEYAQKLIIH